jgi:CBS domain containing-hemolysin-like protein
MGLLLIYLALALGISFLCSIMEAVILSVTFPYIRMQEVKGKKSANLLKRLKTEIDRPLSAILSINTVAHTIGAAGVGAQAVVVFGEVYFGLISAILTLLILVFSEIVPKTIGARYWRQMALSSARIIQGMIIFSYPLVIMAEYLTKIISKNKKPETVSREEVAVLAQLGFKEGVFHESESKMINNLIKLRTIQAKTIMTPRTVIISAPENMGFNEFKNNESYLRHTRIPVYDESPDNITGYVLSSEVLQKVAGNNNSSMLKDIKRPVVIFYENFSIPKLFEKLVMEKEQLAIIVDEYGVMQGIITMEDIVETILGLEIIDEKDIEADMQKLAKKRWERRSKFLDVDQTGKKKT